MSSPPASASPGADPKTSQTGLGPTLVPADPPTRSDQSIAVVIPAYNESGRIGAVVRQCRERFERIIVVDDGSSDDTAAQARDAGAELVRHPINLGQGAALQTGIEWALADGAQWIVTLDADGQHDPADAVRLLERTRASGWDVGLGSRFLGATVGMPWRRRQLLRAALLFQRLTTGLALTDVHNGLRVLSRKAATAIELHQNRMAHASEFVGLLARTGLRHGEGPVTIRYSAQSLAKGQSNWAAARILVDLLLARIGR